MISRIYVAPKKGSNKAESYLIDSKFSMADLTKLAVALTNPILENYYINKDSEKYKFFSNLAFELHNIIEKTDEFNLNN